jgi:hypothetical protein
MNSYLAPREQGKWLATEIGDPRADAAQKRLRDSEDVKDACEGIREIVSNLLGCEEMALFEVDQKQQKLELIWSFGFQSKTAHVPHKLSDPAFAGVLAGEPCFDHVFGDTASALIPIEFGGKTAGVLVLLRLLPQKTKIDELDRALLAVISAEAGKPLFGRHGSGTSERKR